MTLYELQPHQFNLAQPLFKQQSQHHLFCAGVLAGKYPGRVVVDHPQHPRSAFVYKPGVWCYLGGEIHNPAFYSALGSALMDKQFIEEKTQALLFGSSLEQWETVLKNLIPGRLPINTPRYLYVADQQHQPTPAPLPAGFDLLFIDENLPAQVTSELPGDVQQLLNLRTGSSTPDKTAFGYVALQNGRAVAWSVIDCIVGTRGEIGLETESQYRQQGLGSAVSAATIHYGLSHGLTTIHWDVISYNTPSIQMAKRHGLHFVLQYHQNLILFNEVSYLANLAWAELDQENYQATLDFCQQLLALEKGQMYGHFLTGAAWAGLGQPDTAFRHLHHTLDNGWDDLFELENNPTLKVLHSSPEWGALVSRLQKE